MIFGFFSCEEAEDLLTFTIENEASITIPKSTPVNTPFDIQTPDIETNSNEKFENNNTSADKVKDVILKNMTLTITSPQEKTFNFLKSIELYISSNADNEILLAEKNNIPEGVQELTMNTTDQKLDEYIKAESYNLRTKYVTDEVLDENVDILADMEFEVTADPL